MGFETLGIKIGLCDTRLPIPLLRRLSDVSPCETQNKELSSLKLF
jgi:hypothetical protein